MSTQAIVVILTIKLAMAAGAAVLIWRLLLLDDNGEQQDEGGGGGGTPPVRQGPRRRGPHGGAPLPAPPRVRTDAQARERAPASGRHAR